LAEIAENSFAQKILFEANITIPFIA
jgi:hypothetical protein